MSRTVMSSVRLFFTTRYRMSSESGSGIDERAAPRSKCSNRPNVERTSTCLHKVLQAGVCLPRLRDRYSIAYYKS